MATWVQQGIRKSQQGRAGGVQKERVKVPYAAKDVRECIDAAARLGAKLCKLDRMRAWAWLNTVGWPDDGERAPEKHDALSVVPAYLRKLKKRLEELKQVRLGRGAQIDCLG